MTRPGEWRDDSHDIRDILDRLKRLELAQDESHDVSLEARLPASPMNGRDFYYQLPTGGVWHFKFNANSGVWDFVGGPPLIDEVVTSEATSATSFADLSTVGPAITVPFDGEYAFDGSAMVETSSASNNSYLAALKVGSGTPTDDDAFAWLKNDNSLTSSRGVQGSRVIERPALADDVCKMQYRTTNGGAPVTARNRSLAVTPIWITAPSG